MIKILKALAVPAIGLGIVVTGFVYEVLFAGIPYQDPTPKLQERYEFHGSVAGCFYKVGGITLLLGLIVIPVLLKKTGSTKRQ